MKRQEAEERMKEVQRIMERATLYTLLPGLPSIIGGVLALVGCGVSYAMIHSLNFLRVLALPIKQQYAFCILWTAIGIVAVAQEVWLTVRAAKRAGVAPMARPARFAALSLSPSVLVAVVLTAKLLIDGQMEYITPVWAMCYGTGVYTAGLFSLRSPRVLGLAFIVAGAIGLLWFAHYGVVLAAVTFGFFHIAFGLYVVVRSRQGATTEATCT